MAKSLEENGRRIRIEMREPWNPETPFETLIDQFNKGMEYAKAARCSFSLTQILMMAERLIFNTGLFHDDIKVWHATLTPERGMGFKHSSGRHTNATAARKTLHNKQAITWLMQYFVWKRRTTLPTWPITIEQKTTFLHKLNQQLMDMRKKNNDRPHQQCNVPSSNSTNTKATTCHELAMSRFMKMLARPDNGNYCWSHGYIVGDDHTS
jgi:hypothetical protein